MEGVEYPLLRPRIRIFVFVFVSEDDGRGLGLGDRRDEGGGQIRFILLYLALKPIFDLNRIRSRRGSVLSVLSA